MFSIGKEFGGGKVFWLDDTGKHGLIAAKTDQSAKGIAWNPGEAVITSAISDKIYSGQANSDKILGVLGTKIQSAAKLCADYTVTENKVEFSDWYLPSRFELDLLYKQRLAVGGFNTTNGIYWSSTETTTEPATQAWEQEFKFGSQLEDDKDMPNQVRCIRKF